MQSWADRGFGPLREAGEFPSRAAVLGIVAAAMGIARADERLVKLHEAFRVHVAAARPGRVLKDYHSVGAEDWRAKTLTWRDYHHDAHFVALVESDDGARAAEAEAALERPVYVGFLGRRSCPPAVPLVPEPARDGAFEALINAAALARRELPTGERRWGRRRLPPDLHVYLDGHLERHELPAPLDRQGGLVHHDVRRDRLVAPRRAYVNRPYTRVSVHVPEPLTDDPHEAYFDATSESPAATPLA